ncbi:Uncharacterised protein [Orientia tsutsugamushi]|uniref:AAA domain protein n=1 Tax=Orientia tsutsugamushi TaxID=784 RepID=A0A2R8F021_ORITS|nr:hypothetical protein [Orientia tsutsugamushi]SPM44701.1 Uncharacterised protein [Orientia tsutsugamushi]
MTQPTTIIYLTGKPWVDKYSIAKELAAKYGFIVCYNQLINNPIFELCNMTDMPRYLILLGILSLA